MQEGKTGSSWIATATFLRNALQQVEQHIHNQEENARENDVGQIPNTTVAPVESRMPQSSVTSVAELGSSRGATNRGYREEVHRILGPYNPDISNR